ncbi:MAG: hypothetical protein RIK87_07760 [Fuerstiella sp.]
MPDVWSFRLTVPSRQFVFQGVAVGFVSLVLLGAAILVRSRGAALVSSARKMSAVADPDSIFALPSRQRMRDPAGQAVDTSPVPVQPSEIRQGIAIVGEDNTIWNPASGRLLSFFRQGEDDRSDRIITRVDDEAGELLRQWQAEKSAAGLAGVLYDNHDDGHSQLNPAHYPQLTRIRYSRAARQHRVHTGLQHQFRFNGIVLGNSSTALVGGPFWRSQPRLAYCDGYAAAILADQYFGNHLYFYPEHRDYDAGTNGDGGHGDVFPANTPCLVISQGSSGSDQVFIDAFAATLAALRPDVQQRLAAGSVLMPCLQMIFRHCNRQVQRPEVYLTGIAHPPVFQGDQLDKLCMVNMAHSLTADSLPPVAVLEVLSESVFQPGRDYFEPGQREELFTTPAAVARVCHAVQQTRSMKVSAKRSFDLNGRPLQWYWKVLQGDPERIRIQPESSDNSVVSISVGHHERQPIRPGSDLESSRVDIGVFAHNGLHYSAPAIISFLWPTNAVRTYSDDGRILSVRYRTPDQGGLYCDPALVSGRNWTDTYLYDEENRLQGWERRRDSTAELFTADGRLVTATDEAGGVLEAVQVEYVITRGEDGRPLLVQKQRSTR